MTKCHSTTHDIVPEVVGGVGGRGRRSLLGRHGGRVAGVAARAGRRGGKAALAVVLLGRGGWPAAVVLLVGGVGVGAGRSGDIGRGGVVGAGGSRGHCSEWSGLCRVGGLWL